jgi:hypothetical protein
MGIATASQELMDFALSSLEIGDRDEISPWVWCVSPQRSITAECHRLTQRGLKESDDVFSLK